MPFRIHPLLKLDPAVRERAHELARVVGIQDKLDRHPLRLSQGERQRLAVCRALVAEPSVLLADEPTGNQDPAIRGRVLDILIRSAETSGATLNTVTHDQDLLPRFGRVVDFKEFYRRGNSDSP